MKSRLPLAALLAFLFIPVVYLPMFWQFAQTGSIHLLKHYVLTLHFWLVLIGCIAVGIGLRRGNAFAWLGGLLGGAWLLYPRLVAAIHAFGHHFPPFWACVALLMLVGFMVLLLTSPPRRFF